VPHVPHVPVEPPAEPAFAPTTPLDENVVYQCACGRRMEWHVSPASAANVAQFPPQAFHRGLAGELARMLAHDARDHFRMRLLTAGNDEVVFDWRAPFRLITLSDGASTTYGTLNLDTGEYVESRELDGLAGLLRDADVNLLAVARRYAEETGFCAFCHHALTDPRSVSAHYGPVCADHYGLPWG
jgi:hypothetical protein